MTTSRFMIPTGGQIELTRYIVGLRMLEKLTSIFYLYIGTFYGIVIIYRLFLLRFSVHQGNDLYDEFTTIRGWVKWLYGFILIVRFYFFNVNVGFYTLHVTKNIDADKNYDTFLRQPGEIVLERKEFKLGMTSEERFGDTWFSVDIDYRKIYEDIRDKDIYNQKNKDEVFYIERPLFRVAPIVVIEKLIYGEDGTFTRNRDGSVNGGLIHKIFKERYNQLKREPSFFFRVFKDNNQVESRNTLKKINEGERLLAQEKGKYYRYLNYRFTDLVQTARSYPLEIYGYIRSNRKSEELLSFEDKRFPRRVVNAYMENFKLDLQSSYPSRYDYLNLVNKVYSDTNHSNIFRNNEESLFENTFRDANMFFTKEETTNNIINVWNNDSLTEPHYVRFFGKTTLPNFYSKQTKIPYYPELQDLTSFRVSYSNSIYDNLLRPKFIDSGIERLHDYYDVQGNNWRGKQYIFNILDHIYEGCDLDKNEKDINNCLIKEFHFFEQNKIFNYNETTKQFYKLSGYNANGEWVDGGMIDLKTSKTEDKYSIAKHNIEIYYTNNYPQYNTQFSPTNVKFRSSTEPIHLHSTTKVDNFLIEFSNNLLKIKDNFDIGRYFDQKNENYRNGLTFNPSIVGEPSDNETWFRNLGFDESEKNFYEDFDNRFNEIFNKKIERIRVEHSRMADKIREMEITLENEKREYFFVDKKRIETEEKKSSYFDFEKQSIVVKRQGDTRFDKVLRQVGNFISYIFNILVGWVFKSLYFLLLEVRMIRFNIIYSRMFGIGLMLSIILTRFLPITMIIKQDFKNPWIDVFKKYRSYRIRDVVILFVITIVMSMGTFLLEFTGQFPTIINYILNMFLLGGTFYIMPLISKVLRERLSLNSVGFESFGKLSGYTGSRISQGFNISGHLTTRTRVGMGNRVKVGGGMVYNRLEEGSRAKRSIDFIGKVGGMVNPNMGGDTPNMNPSSGTSGGMNNPFTQPSTPNTSGADNMYQDFFKETTTPREPFTPQQGSGSVEPETQGNGSSTTNINNNNTVNMNQEVNVEGKNPSDINLNDLKDIDFDNLFSNPNPNENK